jgi:DNA-binding transcriptional MerR regulator
MKLSAVTRRKLDYWIKTDVIQPTRTNRGARERFP